MISLKTELTPEEQHKKDLERLEQMRPMDDDLMRAIFRNNIPLAQFVLRIMTGNNDLVITSEETQYDLEHLLGARSICLMCLPQIAKVENSTLRYNALIEELHPKEQDGNL